MPGHQRTNNVNTVPFFDVCELNLYVHLFHDQNHWDYHRDYNNSFS